jgi:uncharacterized protein with NAD-binding domain and iron-sulfur cluster
VVVIGAGWAGLGATYHLAQQGYEVTLLEAGSYPGGLVAGWKTAQGRSIEAGIHGFWYPYRNIFALMKELGLTPRVMIDCSHDNAGKNHTRQPIALQDIASQVRSGSPHIMGVMVESHLVAGNQPIQKDLSQLVYGQSITDACVDLPTTYEMLQGLADAVADSRLLLTGGKR